MRPRCVRKHVAGTDGHPRSETALVEPGPGQGGGLGKLQERTSQMRMAIQHRLEQGPVATANVQHSLRAGNFWQRCHIGAYIEDMGAHVILKGTRKSPSLHIFPKWETMNMLVGRLTGANTRQQAVKDGLIHPTPHALLIESRSP